MSFVMDLPPEVETRLQEEAARQGIPPAAVALRFIERGIENALSGLPAPNSPSEMPTETFAQKEAARVAAIRAAVGSMAHLGASVEDLHRERQADLVRDKRQFEGLL